MATRLHARCATETGTSLRARPLLRAPRGSRRLGSANRSEGAGVVWNYLSPQLSVSDVEAATAWYRDVLEFQVTRPGRAYAAVQVGHVEVFLARSDGPALPSTCCVRVDNAAELYALYLERGVDIIAKLADKPWRMREFAFRDPDGNVFRIGQSTRA